MHSILASISKINWLGKGEISSNRVVITKDFMRESEIDLGIGERTFLYRRLGGRRVSLERKQLGQKH